jgi:hypothetical protein
MSWNAWVTVSGGNPEGYLHITCESKGTTNAEALEGVKIVTDMLVNGGGTVAVVRAPPRADSQVNFESGAEEHQGYSRFTISTKSAEASQDGPQA